MGRAREGEREEDVKLIKPRVLRGHGCRDPERTPACAHFICPEQTRERETLTAPIPLGDVSVK